MIGVIAARAFGLKIIDAVRPTLQQWNNMAFGERQALSIGAFDVSPWALALGAGGIGGRLCKPLGLRMRSRCRLHSGPIPCRRVTVTLCTIASGASLERPAFRAWCGVNNGHSILHRHVGGSFQAVLVSAD